MKYIICAAVHYNNEIIYNNQPKNIKKGFVIGGWRHDNCLCNLFSLFPSYDYKKIIQGFLDSDGLFHNRKEAASIAFKAGQIDDESDSLISENLY